MDAPSERPLEQRIATAAVLVSGAALCVNLSTTQIALAVASAALVVTALRRPRQRLVTALAPGAPIYGVTAALLLAVLLSHFFTPAGFPGWGALLRCRPWLGLFPTAFALALAGAPARRLMIWLVLAGAAVAGLLGVVQHFTGFHPNVALLGWPAEAWQVRAPTDPDRFAAVGFFHNRTRFAHVAAVALCFGSALTIWGPSRRARLLALGLSLPLAAALLLTYTRAALGAYVIALALGALLARGAGQRRTVLVVAAALLLLLAVVIAVPSLRERALSAASLLANEDRRFLWRRALEIVSDFGATGVGFGNYGATHAVYYDRVDPSFGMRSQAHNLYLTFLVEMGPLGLAALLAFFATVLRSARCRTADADQQEHPLRRGALMATICLALLSMFHDPVYQAVEAHAFFLAPALLAAAGCPPANARDPAAAGAGV